MARLHCPVCDSNDIFLVAGGYLGKLYRCKKCGYEGPLVVERHEIGDSEPRTSLKHSRLAQEGQ